MSWGNQTDRKGFNIFYILCFLVRFESSLSYEICEKRLFDGHDKL